jgi:DNA-binding NarL/FixJ family response regulator
VSNPRGAVQPASLPQLRAAYASNMLRHCAAIAVAVRDGGPDETRRAISNALTMEAPAGFHPVEALVTVLAAHIDPDASLDELVGWTRGLRPVSVGVGLDDAHPADVDALMAGRVAPTSVPPAAREEAVRSLTGQGLPASDIASRTGMSERTVVRIRERLTARRGAATLVGRAAS